MAALCELISAGLIEKDTNDDVLWTWSYPTVSAEQRAMFIQRCGLSSRPETASCPFLYSQCNHTWYYIYTSVVKETDALPRVKMFWIVLVTKDFNPEKYEVLCRVLSQKFCRTGSPATMLEAYMSVVTRGTCAIEENGKFSTSDYSVKKAYTNSKVKSIIETFGVETIRLYTALLLKKRIVIYYPTHSLQELLTFTRSLPALVWHRQNWDIVYPYMELNDTGIDQLRSCNTYVAGFTDATVESRGDLYDLFVNGSAGQISVASHAKESLAMGKLHKDIAVFMVQCAEKDNLSDYQIIKELANKTKELLNNLKSLAVMGDDGKSYITLECLKDRKMPPASENFLFSLASCEGLVPM
ncbi:hypothetical protein ACJMK2_006222 [Sinanodonta woodiana]|uniref:UDENN domain-containing protein n=1 Tax=Sinanodonta woodiana TaxID=1069815 RepID=A0ABD3VVZ8_SINWO